MLTAEPIELALLRRPLPAWATLPAHQELRLGEKAALQAGPWFAGLSAGLRDAILARGQVRRVAAGVRIASRGDLSACWFGVARGAVRLGTALSDGRAFTLDFVGPGQWFGDIAAIDDRPSDLDAVAHMPSTLVVLAKPALRELMDQHAELRDALLQLNCQRLRHMFRRFEELHTMPLAQRLARQVQRLARQFGQGGPEGTRIELDVSQAELAASVGGSRQRVNRAWRAMLQLGVVERSGSRLVVVDEAALALLAAQGLDGCPE
ncbi:Crp/Fnr family transcriptional regulator [Rubrivivax gelatinosus]|uniref:Crp/Fnr family transcriptional regulator n=1 Tax=Rubrivivax gelatinosus TaxID=28068 RepID=UPI001906D8E4|nr:Crp/Fnr family transcriptional regulator [Rubrivivax gelatinosus]MBK1616602.1 Crp/Fnr family transcriptional regulator [Rubrivivax gelatinosus]